MQKMCMKGNFMSRSLSAIASTMAGGEWFVRVLPKVFASISVTTTGFANRATVQLVHISIDDPANVQLKPKSIPFVFFVI